MPTGLPQEARLERLLNDLLRVKAQNVCYPLVIRPIHSLLNDNSVVLGLGQPQPKVLPFCHSGIPESSASWTMLPSLSR